MLNCRLIYCGAVISVLATSNALAASNTAAEIDTNAISGEKATLEEIIVTAERREADIQKTAIAITVVSGTEIQDRGLTRITDVLAQLPSVSFDPQGKGPQIFIRGVGSNSDPETGDPTVSLSIDGVYQGQSAMVMAATYDVQRVEVLRGPQGTLAGRNAAAGSVNILTNDPKLDGFSADQAIQVGNYNLFRANGAVNTPLSEQFVLRAAYAIERHDGYLSDGYGDADSKSVRLKALWEPSESVSLLVSGEYSNRGGMGETTIAYPYTDPGNPWYSNQQDGRIDVTQKRFNVQLNWDMGFGVLAFLPAYQDYHARYARYFLGSFGDYTTNEQQTSGELRLASPASSQVIWLAGFYYLDSDVFNLDISPSTQTVQTYPTVASRSYAAFGQATYPLTERLRLTGGLRYTKDKKWNHANITSGAGATTNVLEYTSNDKWTNLSYKANLELDLTAQAMLYAGASTGYRAGGFSQGAQPNSFKPETLTSYEIGSKNRFLGDTLQINGSLYYYDYKNKQINTVGFISSSGAVGLRVYNADTAKVYGAELEVSYLIGKHDQLNFSPAYLHTEYGYAQIPGFPFGTVDFTGDSFMHAPRWAATASYQHTWMLPSQASVVARIGYLAKSAAWINSDGTEQAGYGKTDLNLTYNAFGNKWSVNLYSKNLENRAVIGEMYTFISPHPALIDDPRTYGIILSAHF